MRTLLVSLLAVILSGCVVIAATRTTVEQLTYENPRVAEERGFIGGGGVEPISSDQLSQYWGTPDVVDNDSIKGEEWMYQYGPPRPGFLGAFWAVIPLFRIDDAGPEYISFYVNSGKVITAKLRYELSKGGECVASKKRSPDEKQRCEFGYTEVAAERGVPEKYYSKGPYIN